MDEILEGTRLRCWPGMRGFGHRSYLAEALSGLLTVGDTNFGVEGYRVRKSDGGTDFLAATHVQIVDVEPCFDEWKTGPIHVYCERKPRHRGKHHSREDGGLVQWWGGKPKCDNEDHPDRPAVSRLVFPDGRYNTTLACASDRRAQVLQARDEDYPLIIEPLKRSP